MLVQNIGLIYGLTSRMLNTGKAISRYSGPVGVGISLAQVTYGSYQDNWQFGYNAQKATARAIGGTIGGWAGFRARPWAGFNVGWSVGACVEGWGAIVISNFVVSNFSNIKVPF